MNRRKFVSACAGFCLGLQTALGIDPKPIKPFEPIKPYMGDWRWLNCYPRGKFENSIVDAVKAAIQGFDNHIYFFNKRYADRFMDRAKELLMDYGISFYADARTIAINGAGSIINDTIATSASEVESSKLLVFEDGHFEATFKNAFGES